MAEGVLRAGVIGVGALGQHHARVWADLPGARLVGVHDADPGRAAEVAARHGCTVFADAASLLAEVDAVSVAVPTVSHHAVARLALELGRDVLVEKPITATLAEADDLVALAAARGALLQAGHIERFNPATGVLLEAGKGARFVEVHRLGSFSARSLDVDVVLDLMIHDLDIVLALDGSEPVQIDAVGVPVLTPRVDIANARLRFASGLIANLTASRVSVEKVRKFRVFAPRTYVSVDFSAREAQVYRLEADGTGRPQIASEKRGAPDEEPLRLQIAAFLAAVRTRATPVVSGADGRRALALAHAILGRMAAGA
jgi:predicted dehydrogenase